ncbi:hypothetical protein ES708_09242 [subsurface metagenome]
MNDWYSACAEAAQQIRDSIPDYYRSRSFPGILGDIKALPPKKALSLFTRKKGLGKQYAYLYLTSGIDNGMGYQACAAEALKYTHGTGIIHGNLLDVGCAVGVTAGVFGIEKATGFDLFPDLLKAAKLTDAITGAHHHYTVADMTQPWPFQCRFDTVFCGLVCHHLKNQSDIRTFFNNANRVMDSGGTLVITLPSGAIATVSQLTQLSDALECFGFRIESRLTGMVVSTDSPVSLFWMFVIIARKISDKTGYDFVHPGFGFQDFRTPVTREEKGAKARVTATKKRQVKHAQFSMITIQDMKEKCSEAPLVYDTIHRCFQQH